MFISGNPEATLKEKNVGRFSKKQNQKFHAELRSVQRFGFMIDVEKAIKDIQSQKARFVERQSLRCTLWVIEQNGKEMTVVYDRMRKMIVTVLPEERQDPFYIVA